MPLFHELRQHRQIGTSFGRYYIVKLLVHEVVNERVQHDVLRDEYFEPILERQRRLNVSPQVLPDRIGHPVFFCGNQAVTTITVKQQTDARQVLSDSQSIHTVVEERLG